MASPYSGCRNGATRRFTVKPLRRLEKLAKFGRQGTVATHLKSLKAQHTCLSSSVKVIPLRNNNNNNNNDKTLQCFVLRDVVERENTSKQ